MLLTTLLVIMVIIFNDVRDNIDHGVVDDDGEEAE